MEVIMFKNLSVITLAMVLSLILWPQNSQAQDGTLSDCTDAFYESLGIIDGELHADNRFATCQANKGKALVRLMGDWKDNISQTRYAISQLTRNQGTKACSIKISREGQAQQQIGYYVLSGKHAAAWNKFLKGQGCQDVMALE